MRYRRAKNSFWKIREIGGKKTKNKTQLGQTGAINICRFTRSLKITRNFEVFMKHCNRFRFTRASLHLKNRWWCRNFHEVSLKAPLRYLFACLKVTLYKIITFAPNFKLLFNSYGPFLFLFVHDNANLDFEIW